MKRISLLLFVLLISSQVFSLDVPLQSSPSNGAINQNPNVYLYLSTVPGATSYDFEFAPNPSFTTSTIVNRTTNYCPTSELLFGETYYWRVRAKNETATTAWSDTWTFTTNPLGASPSSPSNGSENMDVNFVLSTNKVTGATTIEYEVDVVPTFDSGQLQTYSHPFNYSGPRVSNLQYGQTYYWRVRGLHAVDTSDWSDTWSFTTNALGATPSSPANGSVNMGVSVYLSVNNVAGSTTIGYEVDVVPTFNSDQLKTYSHSNSYSGQTIHNLQYGQTYYWRVRGLHAVDTSDWSDTWSFTTNALGATPSSPANGSVNMGVSVYLSVNNVAGSTTIGYEVDVVPTFNSDQLKTYSHSNSYNGQTIHNLQYNQTYYWRVRGLHDADTSDWSETRSFTTNSLGATPSSPANGSVNMGVSVYLSVNNVAGSTTIGYEVDVVPTFNSDQLKTYSHSNSYSGQTIHNLQYNQTYYWRVRGLHDADTSAWSETRSFTTNPLGATPSSPTNGSVGMPISLFFSANKVTGSVNIDYQLDTTLNFNSELLREFTHASTTSGQTVSNLRYGQKYFWRVRGRHEKDESEWSSVWSFTTAFELTQGPDLVSPMNNAIDITYENVELTWTSLTTINTYQYQLSEDANFTTIVKNKKTSLTFAPVANLTPSKNYYWRVRGENVNGYSPWSAVWAFTTVAVELVPPIQLLPQNNSTIMEDEVDLTWSDVFGANGYKVQISLSESFSSGVSEFLTVATIHPISGLNVGSTYFWRVRAYDNIAESDWSESWSFSIIEPSLEAPVLVSPANNSTGISIDGVTYSWTDVSEANSYTIEISEDESFDNLFYTTSTSSTSHQVNKLLCGKTYFWRVNASDESLISEWSDVWSFATTQCTGVNESSLLKFNIYPNPAKHYIKLDIDTAHLSNSTVQIYSVLGQLIISKPFSPNLEISALKSGMYLLQIKRDGVIAGTAKFLKE